MIHKKFLIYGISNLGDSGNVDNIGSLDITGS